MIKHKTIPNNLLKDHNGMVKWFPLILVLMLLVSSCAPGDAQFTEKQAGFWAGLWHGFISLVTFIISLFNDKVNIYEINNSGWPYNLGFIIGVSIFFGGSSKSTGRRKKK